MEVCFLASGERVATLDAADFDGKTGKAVKQALAVKTGITRFRQRLFLENDANEIPDDEVFASMPKKVQLVVMEFCPPNAEEEEEMMWAASENDTETSENDTESLEEFLKRPLNPMVVSAQEDIEGMTALHYAAECGHVEPMQLLLEARAEINANASGIMGQEMAPLHLAACYGHLEAVRFLIENGAEKDQTDQFGASALELAVERSHFDTARFLIQVGADKDPLLTNSTQALLVAAIFGHEEMVRFLVEVGVDKEQTDKDGFRPLHFAAQEGNLEIVRFLVECGASRTSTTNAGKTALDLASEHGRVFIVRFLSELDSQSPRRKVRRVDSDRPDT
eukprot:s129_g21.t2